MKEEKQLSTKEEELFNSIVFQLDQQDKDFTPSTKQALLHYPVLWEMLDNKSVIEALGKYWEEEKKTETKEKMQVSAISGRKNLEAAMLKLAKQKWPQYKDIITINVLKCLPPPYKNQYPKDYLGLIAGGVLKPEHFPPTKSLKPEDLAERDTQQRAMGYVVSITKDIEKSVQTIKDQQSATRKKSPTLQNCAATKLHENKGPRWPYYAKELLKANWDNIGDTFKTEYDKKDEEFFASIMEKEAFSKLMETWQNQENLPSLSKIAFNDTIADYVTTLIGPQLYLAMKQEDKEPEIKNVRIAITSLVHYYTQWAYEQLTLPQWIALSEHHHKPQTQIELGHAKDYGGIAWLPLTEKHVVDHQGETISFVPLVNPRELQYEGAMLEHCVGGYTPQCAFGNSHIISLRNKNGESLSTVELQLVKGQVDKNNPNHISIAGNTKYYLEVAQHYGKRNSPPSQTDQEALKQYKHAISEGKLEIDVKALKKAKSERGENDSPTMLFGFDPENKEKYENATTIYTATLKHKILQPVCSKILGYKQEKLKKQELRIEPIIESPIKKTATVIPPIPVTAIYGMQISSRKLLEGTISEKGTQWLIDQPKPKTTDTLLSLAFHQKDMEMIKWLIDNGAKHSINMRDKQGFTPLHIACIYNDTEVIKLLLNNGGKESVNLNDNQNVATPLHIACQRKNPEMVNLLIENGAILSIDTEGVLYNTPYDIALENNIADKIPIFSLMQQNRAKADDLITFYNKFHEKHDVFKLFDYLANTNKKATLEQVTDYLKGKKVDNFLEKDLQQLMPLKKESIISQIIKTGPKSNLLDDHNNEQSKGGNFLG